MFSALTREGIDTKALRMASPKVTISDVARAAGVAKSTVSLVLNRRDRIAEPTRRRIQQVIKQLNYVPRPNRSRLRRHVAIVHGKGMILHEGLVNYCREWIKGIREGLGGEGADVSVFCGRPHVSQDLMFQASLEDEDWDGLVFMGVHRHDGYLERAMETGLPIVAMNRSPQTTEYSSIVVDGRRIGQLAADHLAKLGHKRICLFLSSRTYPINTICAGFQQRLEQHNCKVVLHLQDAALTFDDLAAFERHAQRIIDAGVTAVFTGDPAAYRLIHALRDKHVDVPKDISVMGMDNLGFVTDQGLRLCSIDHDKREMGRRAGRMLQDLLLAEGSVVNQTMSIPPRLYTGQTTARCSRV